MRLRILPFAQTLAFLALLAGIVSTPTPAAAQTVPSPYDFIDTVHEVETYVGYLTENRGILDMGPGGGPLVGGRYAIKLSGAFALEGHGYLISTDRNVFDPSLDDDSNLVLLGTSSSLVGGLEGRLRLTLTGDRTWHRLAPYLSAGGGVASDLRARSDLEEDHGLGNNERFTFGPSFLGALAGGTRWLPTDNLSFRLEGGMKLWRLGVPAAFRQLEFEDISVPEQEWVGVGTVELGLSWRF